MNYDFKDGIKSAIPLVVGYVPLSMTFGMISSEEGLDLFQILTMTMFIYSGASQFMMVSLLSAGVGVLEMTFTTLLMNLRMFLMATSFVNSFKGDLGMLKPYISLTITDETFSVSSFRLNPPTRSYVLGLNSVAFLSWILGAVLGYMFGNLLPEMVKESLSMTLYAMFASMLVPQLKQSKKLSLIVLLSGGINTFFTYTELLPPGWGIIMGIVLASAAGATFFSGEKRGE